ncbi:MAG: choice-of-anchor D domain-containing protein [Candidatus Cloacimonetes bacterium]|nr:choice-of-anchor D domain-containing protein [Candidatus Cloacimonadota bacterium]
MRGITSGSSSVENTATSTTRSGKPRAQLTITPAAGILNPTGFTATPVSHNQINLAWTRNVTPDNVMVARNTVNTFGTPSGSYSVGNSISGGGEVIYNSSGTSYNDTGRTANTPYYYKAWSVNGGTPTYSSGTTATATTMLAPITNYPWTETFETDSESRGGWSQIQEQGSKSWTYATGAGSGLITAAHGGALNARFTGTTYSGDKTKLVTPILDLSAKADYTLSFWYGQEVWSPDQNELRIFYRTSPSSSWVEIASYTGNVSVWTQEPGLVLPNPSATYQIAFEGKDLYGYPNVLDDILVDVASSDPQFAVSPAVKDFGSQQIGTSSTAQVFTIKNNGGGTLTVYSVAKGSTNAGEFVLTDTNDYTGGIELGAGASITVSVVFSPVTTGAKVATLTIAHDQDGSPTVVNLSGTGTDSTIRDIPYIQTWDVDALINGWVLYDVNEDDVTWGIGSGGTSDAAVIEYNTDLAMNDWLISPPVVLTGGTAYTVTYSYRCASATYPEKMKVAFGTAQNPTAMTEVIATHEGFINTTYLTGTGTFTPATTGNYYLGFHGYSAANMYNLYVDDVRILIPNSQVGQVIATGATANVTLPTLTVGEQQITPAVAFSGLSGNPVIHVSALNNVALDRLELTIDGGNLAGVTLTFTHGLGFIPQVLAYQIGSGALSVINNPGDWTATTASFTVPGGKGPLSLKVIFPKDRDDTLPVTLASFTATLTSDMFVKIAWIAASETNHSGYNVLRAESQDLSGATKINAQLIADGTELGTQISYSFVDEEASNNATYHYWLESVSLDGASEFFGPLTVTIGDPQDHGIPVVPIVTELLNAYPNPFNPSTRIGYSLKEAGEVNIDIYNLKGQKVRSYNALHNAPGFFNVIWDGRDASGNSASSGVYMYRMSSGTYTSSKKMILAK